MTKNKDLKLTLLNDLLRVESDLVELTPKQHKKCMKHVNKLEELVEKYYE